MPLCEPGNQGSYEITRSPPEAIHTVSPRHRVDKKSYKKLKEITPLKRSQLIKTTLAHSGKLLIAPSPPKISRDQPLQRMWQS